MGSHPRSAGADARHYRVEILHCAPHSRYTVAGHERPARWPMLTDSAPRSFCFRPLLTLTVARGDWFHFSCEARAETALDRLIAMPHVKPACCRHGLQR